MAKNNPHNMADKQYAFCQLYLSNLPRNATQAYLAVYTKVVDPNVAKSAASRLLTNVNVSRYIAEQEAIVAEGLKEKYLATKERVIEEESYLAFSDIGGIFDDQGAPIQPNHIPESMRRAIASVEVIETTVAGTTTRKYKYRLQDKGQALNRLERCFGMQKDVKEAGVDDDLRSLVEKIDGRHRGMLPCEIDEE